MMRSATLALSMSLALTPPAMAQVATSTAGDVGSASVRNGYPAGGGAVALPTQQTSPVGVNPGGTTISTSNTAAGNATGSGSGMGGSATTGGGSRGAGATRAGTAAG